MNAEQVSALSDVELNRAMIWLYGNHVDGFCNNIAGDSIFSYAADILNDDGSTYTIMCGEWEYDVDFLGGYLSWDLTMPLAVEHGLAVEFNPQGTFAGLGYSESTNDNPLRAICEVLVLIKCQ